MQNKAHAVKNRKRCGAKTRSGKSCKNWAMPNGRCRMHGGKSTGAPPEKMKKNSNARTHGLFAKYLPKETLEIVNDIGDMKPIDILYMNIKMQFASIFRAQQIMFVTDKEDHTTCKTKERYDELVFEQQYEIHASWDKQAAFMNSLSRSMTDLRNMLKQYVELSTHDDDRLLEVQRMQSIIDKTKAEIERINKENVTDAPPEITIVDAWTDDDE